MFFIPFVNKLVERVKMKKIIRGKIYSFCHYVSHPYNVTDFLLRQFSLTKKPADISTKKNSTKETKTPRTISPEK